MQCMRTEETSKVLANGVEEMLKTGHVPLDASGDGEVGGDIGQSLVIFQKRRIYAKFGRITA